MMNERSEREDGEPDWEGPPDSTEHAGPDLGKSSEEAWSFEDVGFPPSVIRGCTLSALND